MFRLKAITFTFVGLMLSSCALVSSNEGAIGACYYRSNEGIEIRYIGGYPRAREVRIALQGADPVHFRLIGDNKSGNCGHEALYGADNKQVFFRQHLLPNADPAKFRVFGGGYGGDDKTLYFREKPVPVVDPKGFRSIAIPGIDAYYGVARTDVLYRGEPIQAPIDPLNFVALGGRWVRDSDAVYLRDRSTPVPGADPATFRVLLPHKRKRMRQPYAMDNNQVYYLGKEGAQVLEGAEPDTFRLINRQYAKDRLQVYYQGRIVVGADAATFRVPSKINAHTGYDYWHKYHLGKKVMPAF